MKKVNFFVVIFLFGILLRTVECEFEEDEDDFEIDDAPLEPARLEGKELKFFEPVVDRETFLEEFGRDNSEIPIVSLSKNYFDENWKISKGKFMEFLTLVLEELNPDEEINAIVEYIKTKILSKNFNQEKYNMDQFLTILNFPKSTKKTEKTEKKFNIDL